MILSIITINYNNAVGLRKTIHSVIKQTFADYQFIVIDGGSNDGSVDIIKEYEQSITYWISEKDKGIYNAMNKGIFKASGEYCLFLNSGDYLVDENVLAKIFSQNHSEDIIYGNVLKVFSSGKIEQDKGPQRSQLTLGDMFFDTLPHQSVFIKKELFNKYGLYSEEYKVVSDWVLFLKAIGIDNVPVKYIDINVSYYDMTGVSSSSGSLGWKEREQELKKTLPDRVYKDYQQMAEYRWKVRTYDKIVSKKPLWYFISLYNKLFGRPLW